MSKRMDNMTKTQNTLAPKGILRKWADDNSISPALLAKQLSCNYSHAWQLLNDADYTINLPTLARLLVVYGKDGPAIAIAEAMKTELNQLYSPETVAA